MKKTLHIISHTHWDREWYMSFEQHRMRLVELMDTLIEKMEKDERYKFFHLDGQTIIIDDYLEIKPQMRERLYALINSGRIQVGPWYILQDEFLTSGEANVRNMIEGLRFCRENGIEPVMSGYMPDAFGNISQMPQILAGFGIDNAIFGRGQWPIFFNNRVAPDKNPADKELLWCGADGTSIIGLMFGDWYNNANEMPVNDEEAIKERYNRIIDWLNLTAKTPHLLGMNGCDHQPVQLDLPDSIETANKLLGDSVDIKHSNFKELLSLLRPYSASFKKIEGELTSQLTSGHCRLVDTASTHIPLKQKNHKVQNMLTFKSEPVSSLAMLFGDKYKADMLRYSWKTLMQCHPHDSICCCSCDAVTKEMSVRFDKAYDTADFVLNQTMEYFANNVDTSNLEDINIVVLHTSPLETSDVIKTKIYSDDLLNEDELWLADSNGNSVLCEIKYLGNQFIYTLPKDAFRRVKYQNCYEVSFPVKHSGIGCFVYSIKNGNKKVTDTALNVFENGAENETLKFKINANGTIDITEKLTNRTYSNLLMYEDTGDCGESYNYIQTNDKSALYTDSNARVRLVKNNGFSATFEIVSNIEIPSGLDDKKNRSNETITHEITTLVTLNSGINRIDVKTKFTNKSENHRLRVLFPAGIDSDTVFADGQFDVVNRTVKPWEGWTNPSNTQRMQAFFGMEDTNGGLIVASRGLCEYEVLRDSDKTMALTLLRAVGEVGDWGVFPTPDMQIKKDLLLEYSIIPYSAPKKASAYNMAYTFAGDFFSVCQTDKHGGNIKFGAPVVEIKGEHIAFSAFKKAENGNDLVMRIYNTSDFEQSAVIKFNTELFTEIYETNFGENTVCPLKIDKDKVDYILPAKKIKTLLLKQRI